jgi:hypothetical protein
MVCLMKLGFHRRRELRLHHCHHHSRHERPASGGEGFRIKLYYQQHITAARERGGEMIRDTDGLRSNIQMIHSDALLSILDNYSITILPPPDRPDQQPVAGIKWRNSSLTFVQFSFIHPTSNLPGGENLKQIPHQERLQLIQFVEQLHQRHQRQSSQCLHQ